MDLRAVLKTWNKKTITLSELGQLLRSGLDAELYRLIIEAVTDGFLMPVKASGTNGNRMYPLFLKYRINLETDYSGVLAEIEMLHPLIRSTGYLQAKPEIFLRHRDALQKLNTYLFQGQSTVPVSKKERSFQIFDEEKQLEDRSLCSLLGHLGLTPDVLHYYETPEYCFNDYIPERRSNMTMLICENKDIWFNIRRRMFEDGARTLFGIQLDGVVYGCGNRISEAGALAAYTSFFGDREIHYLYWGDIDRAGLEIYQSLRRNNPETNVALFVEAYCRMIELAEGRRIPDSADHRARVGCYDEIFDCFPKKTAIKLADLLENNKRVPQEIISYENLLTYMR